MFIFKWSSRKKQKKRERDYGDDQRSVCERLTGK